MEEVKQVTEDLKGLSILSNSESSSSGELQDPTSTTAEGDSTASGASPSSGATNANRRRYVPDDLLVSEPGESTRTSDWLNIQSRFPEEPTEEEATRQWLAREKWLVRCASPAPRDTTEIGYEEWFDRVAMTMTAHGLSNEVFKYLCGHAMNVSDARIWRRNEGEVTYEHTIRKFLKARFPASDLAYDLEKRLYDPPRADDVYTAQEHLQTHLGRYVRACGYTIKILPCPV
eukprot:GHVS01086380.1.p1 GENE.GHVS01086380.1~~GHVS01086380.1.p1  ORF type:complete len:231 (-),score=16.39 GHVS01086380.1:22-714(-)